MGQGWVRKEFQGLLSSGSSGIANFLPGSIQEALSSGPRRGLTPPTTNPDTDYISAEELAQVEQMLAHLTAASAQAAAASLVSGAKTHRPAHAILIHPYTPG